MLQLIGQEEEEFFKEIDPEMLSELKEREIVLNEIYDCLNQGELTFTNQRLNQEGFVHPDSRGEYNFQFTYFYEYGAAGHFNKNTIEELARGILEYNFAPIKKEKMTILY